MFSFIINKYLKKKPSEKITIGSSYKKGVHKKKEDREAAGEMGEEEEEENKKKRDEMIPPNNTNTSTRGGGGSPACPDLQGCCSAPNCLCLTTPATTDHHPHQAGDSNSKGRAIASATTTARTGRSNFAKATTSSVFPNTQFTNHESLPPLSVAFSTFTQTYPQYKETQEADRIRQHDYSHLSDHVCLDYTGFTLFSHSQLHDTTGASAARFGISYKSTSLTSQVQYGNQETGLESAIRNRIMTFFNLSQEDYSMVCTANRTSAFKLLAETYPFHHNTRLLTVYDYESEAVSAMSESALKRGTKLMCANFSWPSLRIHSRRLKRDLEYKKKKKKKKRSRGLFVFPLQSRMTGARYPYLWMRIAQENGWHVLLDACALGPKDLDTLGLSIIQPDFIICSFFKVVGENPSGFATLLIKKSVSSILETSVMARSIGVISIVPATRQSHLTDDFSGTFSDIDTTSSFSGPIMSSLICNGTASKNSVMADSTIEQSSSRQPAQMERFEHGETSEPCRGSISMSKEKEEKTTPSEIVELESNILISAQGERLRTKADVEIECMGLDHADSLGLLLISSRLRYITNWLVMALVKLRHPNSESGHPLIRIYGPRIKFERGPAIAFNVFDWKGEKVEPELVQKLADRSNISLSCGFLHNMWFSDKYEEERDAVLERSITVNPGNKRKEDTDLGIAVVNASLGFLSNFEDAYKLWSFVARFLDADFVEKERWRYMALNQKMIEV